MEVCTGKLIDLSDDDQDTEGTSASLVQQQATDSPGSNGNKNSFQGIDLLSYGPIVKYAPEQLKAIRDDYNWAEHFWKNLAHKLPLVKLPFKFGQADFNYNQMQQRKKTANVGTSTADLMTSPQSEDISGQLVEIRNLHVEHVESMAKTEKKKKAAAKKAGKAKTTTSSERGKEEKKKKKNENNGGNGEEKETEKPPTPIEERENVPPPLKQQAEGKIDKKETAGDSSTLQSSYQTCSSGENGETAGQFASSFGAAKPRQFFGRSHNRI